MFIFRLVHVFSQNLLPGGVLPNKEVRGLGPHIRFGGKIWGKVRPSSQNRRKNLGSSVTKRRKIWGICHIYFWRQNLGLQHKFQRQNLGPSPPPRPPNMEVPPWEFTSGVKDVTFVLTYIWFVIENGLLDRIRGWFYVFIKPSFHMIVDDRCDRWNIRSLWLSQLLKFVFHIFAGIVQIAGHIRLLWSSRSLRSLCYGFHMIVTIAAVAALVVSINFLRSLTIVHDHRDRLILSQRSWSLRSLAVAGIVDDRSQSGNQA